MTDTPSIPSRPLEQLRTSQIEHLPPIPPRRDALPPIRLPKSILNALLITQHGEQPILTRPPIMRPINPPLPLNPQLILKEQQQIRTRHRPARKKVLSHPTPIEIIGRGFVRENVDEQLATRFQRSAYLRSQEGVILHVLEQFNRDHSVERVGLEFIINDVAGDDGQVLEPFSRGDAVNVLFLRTAVGEGGDVGVGEDFGKVERC